MRKLTFAIIGVGYWGPNYARILNQLPNVKLKWCCDRSQVALDKIQLQYPQIHITTQLEDILSDPEVDCVAITTGPDSHYALAQRCLGVNKHILVEKPFTLDVIEARKLIHLAKKQNLVIGLDHTFKFNSGIQKLKQLIDRRHLGRIYYVYGLYNALGPIRREVSAMWDLSPHFIYTVNYLLNQLPLSATGFGGSFLRQKMEDVVFLDYEYANGVIFNLHSSWLDPLKVRQLVVVGSKKMAVFDDVSSEGKLKIYDRSAWIKGDPNFANLTILLRNGDVTIPKFEEKEPLKEAIKDFIEAVKNGRQPFASAEEGLAVVKCLAAAQRSIDGQSKKVAIR